MSRSNVLLYRYTDNMAVKCVFDRFLEGQILADLGIAVPALLCVFMGFTYLRDDGCGRTTLTLT